MNPSSPCRSIDIVYFSWSGNTKKVVDVIVKALPRQCRTRLFHVTPKRSYPYPIWLLLSFIPGLGVAIKCESPSASTVILAMPKWTVNCPPITTLLRKGCLRDKKVFLVITYGGFDQDRYAESYRNKIGQASAGVQDMLLVKRRRIQEGDFTDVRAWAAKISNQASPLPG